MTQLRIAYIHGIDDKPPVDTHTQQWNDALAQLSYVKDAETRMVYWADLRVESDIAKSARLNETNDTFERIRPKTKGLRGRITSLVLHAVDPAIRRVTKVLVADVYGYFYAPGMRNAILQRCNAVFQQLQPHVVIAHSMGTVIAVDYLQRGYYRNPVSLITMGSPLGQPYIQNRIGGTMWPEAVQRWLNVYDAWDPVTWPDRRLGNDFAGPNGQRWIRDVEVPSIFDSSGKRKAHAWYGYLGSEPVQNEVFRTAVQVSLAAP